VEHFAPTELIRPWRTATLVVTGIAALELVLLIGAGIVLLGRQIAPHVHAAAARTAAATPKPVVHKAAAAPVPRPHHAVIKLSRAQTKVIVLNGNGVSGAAAQVASLIRARGYQVTEVGNAPKTGYARTIVEYRPHYRAEALRFRRDLNLTVVAPLDGMTPKQMKGAHLVEILGASR
jgi:LytR cell envelope-related transcriptional attenuator